MTHPHAHIWDLTQCQTSISIYAFSATPCICIICQWHTSCGLHSESVLKDFLYFPGFLFSSLLVLVFLFVLILDNSALCVFEFELWTSFDCRVCSYWTLNSLLSSYIGSSLLNSAVFPVFLCIGSVTFITFPASSSNSAEIYTLFLDLFFCNFYIYSSFPYWAPLFVIALVLFWLIFPLKCGANCITCSNTEQRQALDYNSVDGKSNGGRRKEKGRWDANDIIQKLIARSFLRVQAVLTTEDNRKHHNATTQ